MGQVFTWEAIEEGRIPKPESFLRITRTLRATLVDQPAVVSALLFGSVVRVDFNVRSDVDCLVVYNTAEEEATKETLHEIGRTAHALHVPINFTPCDTVLAKTRLHHIGASFLQHLQASMDAGGMVKGRFINLFAPTVSTQQEIESYIKMKMYSIQESFMEMPTYSDERMARFLKKALEAPTHVARKMLIYESVLDGDSKQEVQARYQETMPTGLVNQLNILFRLDAWYTRELENQIKSRDKANYAMVLEHLCLELPRVLAFLRSSILHLNGTR